MPSALYEHTFEWQGEAQSIVCTGSFDSWSASLPLEHIGGPVFRASTRLKWGEKVVYKFIVDGNWVTSPLAPREWDSGGNENNVFQVPHLVFPPLDQQHLARYEQQVQEVEDWRTVRLARWTGEGVELIAALQPSAQLTYNTLRSLILPAVADLPDSFALARLDPNTDELSGLHEDDWAMEAVEAGTLFLVGAEPVLDITLKQLPVFPPAPATSVVAEPEAPIHIQIEQEEDEEVGDFTPATAPSAPRTAFLSPVSGPSLGPSSIPRSRTRYFDFSDSSWSSSLSHFAEDDGESVSELSEVDPDATLIYHGDEDEDDFDDGGSDATFDTAMSESGWVSSAGADDREKEATEWTFGEKMGGPSDLSVGGEDEEEPGEDAEEETMPLDDSSEVLEDDISAAEDEAATDGGKEVQVLPFEVSDETEKKAATEAWKAGHFVLLSDSATSATPLPLHPHALPLVSLIRLVSTAVNASVLPEPCGPGEVDTASSDAAHLPTPPASPPFSTLSLPSLAITPVVSAEEIMQMVEVQRERAFGRWVAVTSV
ncbi:hypothetical protein JCM10213_001015 [Rhodosporidiobolus nylandii]